MGLLVNDTDFIAGGRARWRQMATRCHPLSEFASNATAKYMSGYSYFTACADVDSIKAVWPNYYLDVTCAALGLGAAAEITFAVEPLGGARVQGKFSGAALGNIPNLQHLTSDEVVVSLRRGQPFLVHYWWHNESGIVYDLKLAAGTQNGVTIERDVMYRQVASVPDVTMAGTPSTGTKSATTSYRPAAILGYTNRKAVLVVGDSRNHGVNSGQDHFTDGYAGQGMFERSFVRGEAPYINASRYSSQLGNIVARNLATAPWSDLISYCDLIVSGFPINDLVGGATSAAVLANLATHVAQFPGKSVWLQTVPPKSSSTDSFATTGNQTADATSNANRILVNNAIRGWQIASMAGIIEIADVVESARDSGLWLPGTTVDGLHADYRGNKAIVAADVYRHIHRLVG